MYIYALMFPVTMVEYMVSGAEAVAAVGNFWAAMEWRWSFFIQVIVAFEPTLAVQEIFCFLLYANTAPILCQRHALDKNAFAHFVSEFPLQMYGSWVAKMKKSIWTGGRAREALNWPFELNWVDVELAINLDWLTIDL